MMTCNRGRRLDWMILGWLLAAGHAYANQSAQPGASVSTTSVLLHAAQFMPAIFNLIIVILTCIGVVMIGGSLLKFYAVGAPEHAARWTGRSEASIVGAWTMLVVGSILTAPSLFAHEFANSIYTPGDISAQTNFTYQTQGMNSSEVQFYTALMNFFGLVGMIAWGKGWMTVSSAFNGGRSSAWTGFWFIVGGTGLIYLPDTLAVVMGLLGFNFVGMLVS